ncbi:hypothetical protein Tco_1438556 [Tanacetum coccineum]
MYLFDPCTVRSYGGNLYTLIIVDDYSRQLIDSRGAVLTKTAKDAKKAIQEMAEYSQKWHNGTSRGTSTETSDKLAAIQEQLDNLGREIKKVNEKVYVVFEYSEEKGAKAMAETIEQYKSKTGTDYGSGVARPKIVNKDQFELKGQFLKELRENMFSGSDNEDANEHIEKVLEIVDLFHVPNITEDQLML